MKKLFLFVIMILVLVAAALLWWPLPPERQDLSQLTRASITVKLSPDLSKPTTGGLLSFLGIRRPGVQSRPEIGTALINVVSTGFGPDPNQTDATPCITASGKWVRAGTVASNFLPLGTLLKIKVAGEELPGTFIVEDRMADRFNSRIDIWFAQTSQALDFGKRHVEITVIGYGKPGQSLAETEDPQIATAAPLNLWATVKLRARSIADFLATRGTGVNRFDVDCLALQAAELKI